MFRLVDCKRYMKDKQKVIDTNTWNIKILKYFADRLQGKTLRKI